jgi:hypothetical protein
MPYHAILQDILSENEEAVREDKTFNDVIFFLVQKIGKIPVQTAKKFNLELFVNLHKFVDNN